MSNDGRVGGNSYGSSVLSSPGVGDVLNDPVSVVGVCDGLNPAVREVDCVAAGGHVPVPLLGLGEVGSAVVVCHSVLIVVDGRLRQVGSSVASSRVSYKDSSWKGGDSSEESSSEESLRTQRELVELSGHSHYLHAEDCWVSELFQVTAHLLCRLDIYTCTDLQ